MSDEPTKKSAPFLCYYRGCGLRFDTSKGRNIHIKHIHYNNKKMPVKNRSANKSKKAVSSKKINGSALDSSSPNYDHVTRYLQTSVIYKNIFPCALSLCECFFNSEEDLRQHMDRHFVSIKCPYDECDSIIKMGEIPEHLLDVHKSNEGTCNKCGELIYYIISENHARECQTRLKILKLE